MIIYKVTNKITGAVYLREALNVSDVIQSIFDDGDILPTSTGNTFIPFGAYSVEYDYTANTPF